MRINWSGKSISQANESGGTISSHLILSSSTSILCVCDDDSFEIQSKIERISGTYIFYKQLIRVLHWFILLANLFFFTYLSTWIGFHVCTVYIILRLFIWRLGRIRSVKGSHCEMQGCTIIIRMLSCITPNRFTRHVVLHSCIDHVHLCGAVYQHQHKSQEKSSVQLRQRIFLNTNQILLLFHQIFMENNKNI